MSALSSGDWDLMVDTKNLLGAQTVRRVFSVAPGTTQVSVRYRFQTVATLFGTFDANAATPWFTRTLPIGANGDTVELTLTVANAVDNAHLSILYADVVRAAGTRS